VPDWDNEEFLTVAEVAERLRLNQQTIRNWIDAGTLPALRIGRRVRVLKSDFNQLVTSAYNGKAPDDAPVADSEAFWS
jgi:excisionase family DNA binding protein